MPRYEEVIGRYNGGTVIEKEITEKTDWVQMSGKWMIRCDNEAKAGGRGLWVLFDTARGASMSYKGVWKEGCNFSPDPKLWIEDKFISTYTREKDYS